MSLCVVTIQCAVMKWEGSAVPLAPLGVEAHLVMMRICTVCSLCVYTNVLEWVVPFLPLYTTKVFSTSDIVAYSFPHWQWSPNMNIHNCTTTYMYTIETVCLERALCRLLLASRSVPPSI